MCGLSHPLEQFVLDYYEQIEAKLPDYPRTTGNDVNKAAWSATLKEIRDTLLGEGFIYRTVSAMNSLVIGESAHLSPLEPR